MVKRRSTHHSGLWGRLELWPRAAAATGDGGQRGCQCWASGDALDPLSLTAVNLVANDNEEGDAGAKAVDGDAGLSH